MTAPGSSVTVQLFLTHQNFLQGFQVVLLYDRKILTFESATVGGLDLVRMGMPPEFFEVFNEPEFLPVLDRVSAGVLFDAPDEYLRLPPGDRQTILAFHFQTRKDSTLVATCCNHPPASCI
ncbi:MAG: hypothetical protein HY717_14915 [Planctomycetes bacterium]|nr:hypothetical protein [Planctomycetota bacterium]